MSRWRMQDAEKHFSEVVEKALTEGPQTIAVAHGRSVVVSASGKEKGKPVRRPTMAEVIRAAPCVPEFKIPRRDEYPVAPTFD